MNHLKSIREEKIFNFSEFQPTKYNGNIITNNIMEWLRTFFLDKNKNADIIKIKLIKFLDETNIDKNTLKTFISEQDKTSKISSFKIKLDVDEFDEDIIVFFDFKKDNSKKVWENI